MVHYLVEPVEGALMRQRAIAIFAMFTGAFRIGESEELLLVGQRVEEHLRKCRDVVVLGAPMNRTCCCAWWEIFATPRLASGHDRHKWNQKTRALRAPFFVQESSLAGE
jgi:hypothetical protein